MQFIFVLYFFFLVRYIPKRTTTEKAQLDLIQFDYLHTIANRHCFHSATGYYDPVC